MKEDYPENRVEQIQEESQFEFLMDEKQYKNILHSDKLSFQGKEIHDTDILYIICTSGSTGRPKAVVVERLTLTHFWKWVEEKFPLNSSDRYLQIPDFTFDISLIDVCLFLSKGCEFYFSAFKGSAFTLAYEIETFKINALNTVVNNANMLLDEKVISRADYSSLHTVILGGGRFSYGLYKKCKEHWSDKGIHNLYGVTEVPVYSHYKTMQFNQQDLNEFTVSVGKPLGKVTALVVKDGEIQKENNKGEILLGGASLMREYANNPEKTTEVFTTIDGKKYYKTGDIGHQNERGDFFITGRMDDTIKYRGFRIDLLDIDSYILSRDYVQDAVTIAIEKEETQNTTICFMIKNNDMSEKEIKKDLAKVLLPYQIPERIHFVTHYPINNNQKVCKRSLKQDYIAGKRFYT